MGAHGNGPNEAAPVQPVDAASRSPDRAMVRRLPLTAGFVIAVLAGGILWMAGGRGSQPHQQQGTSTTLLATADTAQPRVERWARGGDFGAGYVLPDQLVPLDIARDEHLVVLALDGGDGRGR